MSKFVRLFLVSLLIGSLAFMTGCGGNKQIYVEAPTLPPIENVSLNDPFSIEKTLTVNGVDIIMDTTDSMAGFAQNPALENDTAFVRSISKLIYASSNYSRNSDVRYYRSDADVIQISEQLFKDYDAPGFYVPRRWYTARQRSEAEEYRESGFYGQKNIANAIQRADPSRVTVIVTDLFENNNTNQELISQIKTKYLAQGGTAAVVAIRSEFDGKVYDIFETNTEKGTYYHGTGSNPPSAEDIAQWSAPTIRDIGKWEDAVRKGGADAHVDMKKLGLIKTPGATPAFRPFYLLFLGDEDVVQMFVSDYLSELRRIEGDPIRIGEPPLMFIKAEHPMLIATDAAGDKLALDSQGLSAFEVAYIRYANRDQDDTGSLATSRELPANLWTYLIQADSGVKLSAKIPLTLVASANAGSDSHLLEELYGTYELVPTFKFYTLEGSSVFLEDRRKRETAFRAEPYVLTSKEISDAFTASGGSFRIDAGNKFRANAELEITIDPAKLPAEINNCRIEVDIEVRANGIVYNRTKSTDDFPWVRDWTLRTAGQSVEMWDRDASMRKLDATINLDSFVKALIASKEEVEVVDPDPFPAEKLVNAFAVDLMIKR